LPRLLDHLPPPSPEDHEYPRWLSGVALTLGAVCVGYAIHIRDGEYTPYALWQITLAMLLCAAGVAFPRAPDPRRLGGHLLVAVLATSVGYQFLHLLRSPPGGWNWWSDDVKVVSATGFRFFYGGVGAASLLSIGLLGARRIRLLCLACLFAIHFALGAWMIRASPSPHIDVFLFQQEAPRALLHGQNPYRIEFADIYHGTAQERDREVYGHGLSEQGKLKFGFPYPPLSLYLATLGYALAGDHRYAQLAAMTLASFLVAFCRPGRISALAAVLLLFTPRAFFVLGRGWTEPFVVLMIAATVFCACRRLRWALPVALGLLLAVKQYMVFAAPLALLLVPRPWTPRRVAGLLGPAVAVAAVVTAPLALWDWHAFFHSAAVVQKVAPFRDDALSYLVWIDHLRNVQLDVQVAFAMMLVGMALALWRLPPHPSGFAAALAMTFLPFIAFNKQAFANYYYFVIGALCCAVAALPPPGDEFGLPPKSQPPVVR